MSSLAWLGHGEKSKTITVLTLINKYSRVSQKGWLHSKKILPCAQVEFPVHHFLPISSSFTACHHWAEFCSILTPPFRYLETSGIMGMVITLPNLYICECLELHSSHRPGALTSIKSGVQEWWVKIGFTLAKLNSVPWPCFNLFVLQYSHFPLSNMKEIIPFPVVLPACPT